MSQVTDYKVWIAIEKHVTKDNGDDHYEDVDCAAPSVPCENIHQARKVAASSWLNGANASSKF